VAALPPTKGFRLDKPPRLEVTYVVSRWDVVSMYLGSWAARMVAAPGVGLVLLAITQLPNARYSLMDKIQTFGLWLALAILAPLVLVLALMSMHGTTRLVGKKVHLVIDDAGVQGWPLAPYQDRTWPRIRKVRRLRGVITLPFRQFGTRAGWVAVPECAFTAEQLTGFRALLISKGVL
jgi:hypothetical protein